MHQNGANFQCERVVNAIEMAILTEINLPAQLFAPFWGRFPTKV
jgi:hypothetical protein